MRAEVMREQSQQQQPQQQGEGMCAAGRWLLGTFFAALTGFVAKNFMWPSTAAVPPYSLGCLALDAALVGWSINGMHHSFVQSITLYISHLSFESMPHNRAWWRAWRCWGRRPWGKGNSTSHCRSSSNHHNHHDGDSQAAAAPHRLPSSCSSISSCLWGPRPPVSWAAGRSPTFGAGSLVRGWQSRCGCGTPSSKGRGPRPLHPVTPRLLLWLGVSPRPGCCCKGPWPAPQPWASR
jgi:hypothetical protein